MRAAVLLLFAVCALAAQLDFRKVTPGMTTDQVRAAESGEPTSAGESRGRTILRYRSTEFLPITSSIQYEFLNDSLDLAFQNFTTQHDELNDFVADFHAVEAKLRSTLKAPTCEQAIWLDDSLQAERIPYLERDRGLPSDILPSDASMGLSISLNHLSLVVVWNTPALQVVHMMVGVDHKILHRIEYRSPESPTNSLAQSCRTPR
jgi:hypothetical protein